jgi:hypothetical protein
MSLTFLGDQNGRAAKRAQKKEKETDLLFTTWMEFLIVVESWVGYQTHPTRTRMVTSQEFLSTRTRRRVKLESLTPSCPNVIYKFVFVWM